MHEWKKEVHLAMRTFLFFFSFVTVSQLNLDHSVLALCVSTLDGSVPYAPFNGTWIHVQFFFFFFFCLWLCLVSGKDRCESVFLHKFWFNNSSEKQLSANDYDEQRLSGCTLERAIAVGLIQK